MLKKKKKKNGALLKPSVCCSGDSAEAAAKASASEQDGDIKRVSTREWARSTGYDPVKIFNKVCVPHLGAGLLVWGWQLVDYWLTTVS